MIRVAAALFSTPLLTPFLVRITTVAVLLSGATQTEARDNHSTIRVVVDTDYDDSASSLDQLADLARLLPPRRVVVWPGDSLSSILLRYYRFGNLDHLPKTLKLISEDILKRNNLAPEGRLFAGEVIALPNLPPRATPHRNRTNARSTLYSLQYSRAADSSDRLIRDPIVRDPSVRSSSHVLFTVANVRTSAARELVDRERARNHDISVPASTLGIMFASCPKEPPAAAAIHSVLNDSERQRLRHLLTTAPRRPVTLFILDSGWPSAMETAGSLRALYSLFDSVEDYLRIPRYARKQYTYRPALDFHCRMIERALGELIALEQSTATADRRVQVVYLPLILDQPGAAAVTQELLYIGKTVRLILAENHTPGRDKPNDPGFKTFVDTVVGDLVASLPTSPPPDGRVRTDKAIIEAVYYLWEYAAKAASSRSLPVPTFFMNQSWTVSEHALEPYFPPTPRGLNVAATGNDKQNVDAEPVTEFAHRALNNLDTVAVMNVTPTSLPGVACDSSITQHPTPEFRTVAFDGEVTAGCCGTSFAAPRVSWHFAVAEAYRVEEVTAQDWLLRHTILLKGAGLAGHGYATAYLDIAKLLNGSQAVLLKKGERQ